MPRSDVTIPTADGEAAATLHLPDGDGPWPGVLMFPPDAGGARDTFSDMGDRMASMGYATWCPTSTTATPPGTRRSTWRRSSPMPATRAAG